LTSKNPSRYQYHSLLKSIMTAPLHESPFRKRALQVAIKPFGSNMTTCRDTGIESPLGEAGVQRSLAVLVHRLTSAIHPCADLYSESNEGPLGGNLAIRWP